MKVVVVGAGISGLATAWHLVQRGADVTVLESAPRAGGVIGTLRQDGFLLETAANGFLHREPALADLLDALHLRDEVRPAEPTAKLRFIYTRGRLRALPASPPAFLASDVLPTGAKLRLLMEVFSRRGTGEDESLAQFARRHVGVDATQVLIDAAQTGIFAGDVEKLSVEATFPKLVALERRHRSLILGLIRGGAERRATAAANASRGLTGTLSTFSGGMQTLTDALAAALGDRLRLGAAVSAVRREAERWVVQLPDGAMAADRLVLATPAEVTAAWLAPWDEALSATLRAIPYAPIAAVHLGFSGLARPPEGFGFLIPSREQREILGALHVTSFFPFRAPSGHTLVTVMVGGARRPELVGLDDASLLATVRRELAEVLGLTAEPHLTHIVRWPRGIPQYEVGHLARMEALDAHVRRHPGLFLTGNAYRGVGVVDCVRVAPEIAAAVLGESTRPTGTPDAA